MPNTCFRCSRRNHGRAHYLEGEAISAGINVYSGTLLRAPGAFGCMHSPSLAARRGRHMIWTALPSAVPSTRRRSWSLPHCTRLEGLIEEVDPCAVAGALAQQARATHEQYALDATNDGLWDWVLKRGVATVNPGLRPDAGVTNRTNCPAALTR